MNKKAKDVGNDGELAKIASRLEAIENNWERLEADLRNAKFQFGAFDEKVDEIEREIEATLKKGDKEELGREIEKSKREIRRLDDQLSAATKDHSNLFRNKEIAMDLLAPLFKGAFDRLEALHDQGKIPNTTIPVLQDRLSAELCICGESLAIDNPVGAERRAHIQKLIDDSQRADEIQEIVTDPLLRCKTAAGGRRLGG